MEIIGVQHIDEIYEPVRSYIDTKYPNLESIMLEIPPRYEEYSHIFQDNIFGELATYYGGGGTRVICGDRKHWEIMGFSTDEIIEMANTNPIKLMETTKIFNE